MSDEFGLESALEEIKGQSEPEQETSDNQEPSESTEAKPTEGQAEAPGGELTIEQILKGETKKKDFSSFLKEVNELGAIHNGTPVKIESPEQVKEALQKYQDYTKKTQEHAETVKVKEEEFSKREAAFKEMETRYQQQEQVMRGDIQMNRIMKSVLAEIQAADPELFGELDRRYQARERELELHSPVLKQFEDKITNLENQLKQARTEKASESLGGIRKDLDNELKQVQSAHAARFKDLGVVIDWNKVKDTWSKDSTNSMSVEQALDASYGKELRAAHVSHAKLLETKLKAEKSKNKNPASLSGSGAQGSGNKSYGSYADVMNEALETMR